MKRQIKFRAWDSYEQVMLSFDELKVLDSEGTSYFDVLSGNYQDLTPMQFTGLTDAEDVEIYEGDILTHPEFRTNVVVEWKRGAWHLSGWDVIKTDVSPGKVLGNVYQNPELIK